MEWKVGDRVEVVKVGSDRRKPRVYEGNQGTVVLIDEQLNMALVKFDEYVDGHNGNKIGFTTEKDGHCWWFEEVDEQYTYGIPTLQEHDIRLEKIRAKKNNYW